MTPRGRLQLAIELAVLDDPRALACRFCGCAQVEAIDDGLLGARAKDGHYARTLATACRALSGGLAARIRHEDLWARLDPWLDLVPADYGDDTELAVINDELAAL